MESNTVSKEQMDAVEAFKKRQDENDGKQKNNASLPAGSPMYYYCRYCYALTDKLPESDCITEPKECCNDCQAMKDKGWLL